MDPIPYYTYVYNNQLHLWWRYNYYSNKCDLVACGWWRNLYSYSNVNNYYRLLILNQTSRPTVSETQSSTICWLIERFNITVLYIININDLTNYKVCGIALMWVLCYCLRIWSTKWIKVGLDPHPCSCLWVGWGCSYNFKNLIPPSHFIHTFLVSIHLKLLTLFLF